MNDGTEWIRSREGCSRFLQILLEKIETQRIRCEPESAPDLLNAIAIYMSAIDGYYKNMAMDTNPENATWRIFAQILAGALCYE